MAKGKYEQWLTKDGLLKLESWARDGLTDEQIAKNIGISRSTLNNWKINHLDILDTMSRGKEVIDIEVENALLKRALGYTYTETKIEKSDTGIKKTTTTKEVIADTTAQRFWLRNRQPDKWRDKVVDNQSNNDGVLKDMLEGFKNDL